MATGSSTRQPWPDGGGLSLAKSETTFKHAVVVSALRAAGPKQYTNSGRQAEDFVGDLVNLAIDEFLIEGPTVFLVTG
jgi:hypothetical protein